MESMATTAPTPKIMPSMVSRLRSLCAKRLASPIFNSGRTCPNICLFPPRHGTHRVATGFLLALILAGVLVGGGIGEGNDFAGLNAAREDHHGFALFEELNFARHKLAVLLRSEEHTSELQSPCNLVCRLLLEKKKKIILQGTVVDAIVDSPQFD